MPWIRIDERFDEHLKFLRAGPLPTFLWLRCLAYCNRNLTDGFIPRGVAEERAWSADPNASRFLIDTLVEVGLWEKTPTGYQMHNYLKYQPSKHQVEEERGRKQAAGQAGGRASAQARGQAKSNPVPVPVSVPVLPVPLPGPKERDKDSVPAARSRFARPTLEEVHEYCRQRQNAVDPGAWFDHYTSNGWRVGKAPMSDWKAAVRTWERNNHRPSASAGRKMTAAEVMAFANKEAGNVKG